MTHEYCKSLTWDLDNWKIVPLSDVTEHYILLMQFRMKHQIYKYFKHKVFYKQLVF